MANILEAANEYTTVEATVKHNPLLESTLDYLLKYMVATLTFVNAVPRKKVDLA